VRTELGRKVGGVKGGVNSQSHKLVDLVANKVCSDQHGAEMSAW
jgi:hypothetical protein